MAKFGVIIAAAGASSRFGGNGKKQFEEIGGRAVFLRAIEPFQDREDVGQIILAIAAEDAERVKTRWGSHLGFHGVKVVNGGAERADTVAAAFEQLPGDCDHVAIHDAARPLVTEELIDAVFKEATMSGAAILALPVSATLKRVDEHKQISATVPRADLWQAQTPQVFRRTIFAEALAKRGQIESHVTDDAQLVEAIGHPVTVVMGRPDNFKITTPADLELAKAIVKSRPAVAPKKGWLGPPII